MTTPDGTLLLEVGRDELLRHLRRREKYHLARSAVDLREAMRADREARRAAKVLRHGARALDPGTTAHYAAAERGNSADALRNRSALHRAAARRLGFYAGHLPSRDYFWLSPDSVRDLEFLSEPE